jgi:uncharacterized membrane protein YfcA
MPLLSLPVIVGAVLAVLIGVSLGLLGGGGSILTVPILVYVIGVPAHEAIALSLLVVGTTSVTALIPHARASRVRWRTGLVFGAASMIGAFGAGKVAHYIPSTILLVAFGAMMLITAVAMMRSRSATTPQETSTGEDELPILKILAEGLVVGAITGLVGAGGGFLVVPALMWLGKLPMRTAVGTSLLVIAMKSFAGFSGYITSVSVDWPLAALVTSAAVVGSFGGAALAGRMPQDMLRRAFAWFVVTMAVFVLFQELPRAFGVTVDLATAWPWILGAAAVPLVLAIVDLARRARQEAAEA